MRPDLPRFARLKRMMDADEIDALVCFKPEHSFYLSGFNPIIWSHPVVTILPREGEPVLLCHALRDDHGRAESFIEDIRLYGAWSTKLTMGPNWAEALCTILAEQGLSSARIGIEEDHMPVARHRMLSRMLPAAYLADAEPILDRCRLVKDPDEIANARIAAEIADYGMETAIEALARGGSEQDAATASMAAMNAHWIHAHPDIEVADFGTLEGGAQNGLWTWVLGGDRMFRNCDNPTGRRPQTGETTAIFIWTVANGIHAENERTVAHGPLAGEKRRAIDTILELREDVAGLIRPGTPIRDLFAATKAGLEARGYGANIPGRIGHSIGIGAHEKTSLDESTEILLEPGMMFTLEPNLRVPGVAATQISDTVLVTETGCESLTRSRGGYLEV